MPSCKIKGCRNPAIAKELCATHYMRHRRTGDPTLKRKPGPKPQPKPQGKIDPLMGVGAARGAGSRQLHAELTNLRSENAALRMQLAQAQRQRPVDAPSLEMRILQDEIRKLQRQLAQARATKPPPDPSVDVVALQQQLKAARTRVHNLTVEKNAAWRARDEARRANPVAITKANLRKLQKVFHPDPEHDTATPERKQQLREAAQTFNAIKFNVPGRKEKPKPSR